MRRIPLGALLPVLMVLAACSGQTPTPAATPTAVAITADPSSIALSPTNIIPTPPPQGTPVTTTATATPTPASFLETSTPMPTQEPTMDAPPPTARPSTTLAITVAPISADVPEYSRSQWNHWTDEDGDCQDARQEALISESLVEVTFESERKCRVATGRWYGAFTGIYVKAPGDLARIHRMRASGQCPEVARGCSCESGIMVLKQQSRPQNKEHPIDATTQPSRSHPNRV